jgi:hypothetical protein
MMEILKSGVAAMLLALFATAQASADGDAGRGNRPMGARVCRV